MKYEWGKVLVAGGLLVLALSIAFVPLFGGRIVAEDDVSHYYIPAFKFFDDSLAAGEDPMMAPVFSGFPLGLTQVGGFLDPLNMLLFEILPFLTAYHARIFLSYFLAGIFTYLFARSIGLSFLASVVAMFAYVTAQNIIPGANILRSNVFFLMPLLFYALNEIHRATESRHLLRAATFVALGAGATALALVGAYTQLVIYSLVAAGAFAAFLSYRRFSWAFIGYATALFGLGVTLAVPYIFAVLDLVVLSARAGGLDWVSASASVNLGTFLQNVTVNLFVPPWHGSTLQSLYIGSLSVLFFFVSAYTLHKNKLAVFFWGLLGFSLLSSLPYPLFYLMHLLPVFELFRFPPHWLLVTSFAMSVLAGIGVERLCTSAPEKYAFVQRLFNFRSLRVAIIAICMVNLILPTYIALTHQSVPSEVLLEEPWIIKTTQAHDAASEPFRTYQIYPSVFSWFLFAKDFNPTLQENEQFNREYAQTHLISLLWGMDSVRGFDNLVPRRYAKVLEYLERKQYENALAKGYTFLPDDTFSLLGMMNVKYVWTIPSLESRHEKDAHLVEIGSFQTDKIAYPVHLYENKRFLPRWYIPPRVVVLGEDDVNFATIIEQQNDFSRRAFIECTVCKHGEFPQPSAQLRLIDSANDHYSFKSNSGGPYWLVVSNSKVPGWHAHIDGSEVPLHYANYIYQGILVPAGEHAVTIRYRGPYDFSYGR